MDAELNKAWQNTCKVLLGEEIGPIGDYEEWLKGLIDANDYRKSTISGKEVAFAIKEYASGSKFLGFDEIDFNRKFEPLDVNEIKDIDSIIEAIHERDIAYYCGDVILGNSGHISRGSNLSDAFYVSDSAQFFNVKYMAYCTVGRENSYCFGTHAPGGSEFLICCSQTVNVRRAFELYVSMNSADCYYVYGLNNCSNCFFSFNLKNRKNCIGNLELDRDRYQSIRKKLLAEIVDELRKHKYAPSLLDIVAKTKVKIPPVIPPLPAPPLSQLDKQPIEKEFCDTTRLIFGRPLQKIDDYSEWLYEHAHRPRRDASAISGRKILWLPYGISLRHIPEDRLVTIEEAEVLGCTMKLAQDEAEAITIRNAHESIGKIAYFKVDFQDGQNTNLIDCTFYVSCTNCYMTSMMVRSKNCACGMWPKESSNCFGLDSLMESNFCVKCYHSTSLTRCFEMDACRDCADSLFCHNCESLSNSMFCFNAKSKRYAIGNVEIGREKYTEIKKLVLDEVVEKLERDKKLDVDIYNVGCR